MLYFVISKCIKYKCISPTRIKSKTPSLLEKKIVYFLGRDFNILLKKTLKIPSEKKTPVWQMFIREHYLGFLGMSQRASVEKPNVSKIASKFVGASAKLPLPYLLMNPMGFLG